MQQVLDKAIPILQKKRVRMVSKSVNEMPSFRAHPHTFKILKNGVGKFIQKVVEAVEKDGKTLLSYHVEDCVFNPLGDGSEVWAMSVILSGTITDC